MARAGGSGLLGAVLAAVLLALMHGPAAPRVAAAEASPFDGLLGRWVGEGRLGIRDGTSEDVKCRVTYLAPQAASLTQTIRCAAASGSVEVRSTITHAAGKLTGTWRELSRDMGGEVTGSVTPEGFRISIKGDAVSANMVIILKGNKQIIEIQFLTGSLLGLSLALEKG